MHVLIIGGNRFVGYLLAWRLLARGDRVTLLNRGSIPDPFGDRVERIRCDRTTAEFDQVLAGRSFDAVVDLAAFTGADAAQSARVFGNGRAGHYVMISTGQVYLVLEGYAPPAREEDYAGKVRPEPADPHDLEGWHYGVWKRDAEDILSDAWETAGFPATRLRVPMVNGERDYFRRIESYLWRILDGGPVLLPDGGRQVCRHIYGADLAQAIAGMLGSAVTFGRAYDLCQEEQVTTVEVVGMLAEMAGAPNRVCPVPSARLEKRGIRPSEISPFSGKWMSVLDPSLAVRELGFRHRPLAVYLQAVVDAFISNPPTEPPGNYRHRPQELLIASEAS